jgi:putative membrane protein
VTGIYQNKVLNPILLTFNKPNNIIWVLAILHVVGIGGFSFCGFWNDWFTFLVPFHLLITATALLIANPEKSKGFAIRLILVGVIGWLVELIGVKTGLIFGNYQYEGALGIKIADVPPLIGVNWILMVYSSNSVLQQFNVNNKLILIISGSIGITLLDVLIEPVAINLNFWSWDSNVIPIQNYVGWFLTAVLLNSILTLGHKQQTQNSLALPVLLMQIGFFGALNLKLLLFGSC